jgi:2',3'-cyclic-nucleotide 2'-phosphodiesterase (5'-nucleotidase family)
MTRSHALRRGGIPVPAAVLLLLLSVPFAARVDASAGPTLTVIGSTAIEGEILPRTYDRGREGGLSRIATVIRSERESGNPMVLFDAGDFAADNDYDPWGKTRFEFDMLAGLGYDAVTPGEREMLQGLKPLKALYARHPEVKVVSANIEAKSGEKVWPEYVVLDKSGVKVGVTGVTGGSFYSFNLTRGIQKSDDFTFEDPRTALQRVIPEIRREADVVVVLLHEGPNRAERLADEVPGMDVILVGHNPGFTPDPVPAGGAVLLRPGTRGRLLSVLDLNLGGDHKILGYRGRSRIPGGAIARDSKTEAAVTRWVDDWKARKAEAQRRARDAESSQPGGH